MIKIRKLQNLITFEIFFNIILFYKLVTQKKLTIEKYWEYKILFFLCIRQLFLHLRQRCQEIYAIIKKI